MRSASTSAFASLYPMVFPKAEGKWSPKSPKNPTTDNRLITYKTMYKNRITYVII